MDQAPLRQAIIDTFDGMSAQLQTASRYILDHPRDVALLSMREQSKHAGVQPATMTRLAKHLGLDGYDAIRAMYAEAVRGKEPGFAGKAGAQVASQKLKGDHALAADMLASISTQVAQLAEPQSLNRIVEAATLLAAARRVYCLGLRSSHSVTWQLHYMMSLIGEKSVMLDGLGGTGADAIGNARSDDVLLVASVLPYTRATIEIAEYAHQKGVPVVAVTDSEVAPLAQFATVAVLVATESASFFHTMSPAFAVAEVLGTLIAGNAGENAVEALRRSDELFASFKTHLKPRNPKKRS
ncbi:MurR/RpiR family transcriptional regulator [Rhizobium leguminosarum]|uniref:MurR/RpiR family transcriptional regulator n=1 Tax=Rhizobium leguminosarum TaxID=384 RepID=UPI0004854683|nr:MurR/RpiR family transcriptional regulator [Rhizobium leguminosarum]